MRTFVRIAITLLALPACGSRSEILGGRSPSASPGIEADAGGDAGAPSSCGETRCGTECVDLSSDPVNCGACGHDCLGGACAAGRCQPVQLAKIPGLIFVAVNSKRAYVASFGGEIWSIDLPLGKPSLVTGSADAVGLAANEQDVFWISTCTGAVPCDRALWVARGGSPNGVAVLVNTASTKWAQRAAGIALDASHVYWYGGDLDVIGLDGSAYHTIPFPSQAFGMSLAVDASDVYWTSFDTLGRTPLPGGPAASIAQIRPPDLGDLATDGTLAIDSTSLYVASGETVVKTLKAGGPLVPLATGQPRAVAVVVDDLYVYWANLGWSGDDRSIMRVPKTGGTPEVLARSQKGPQHMAIDAVSIYWVNGSDGTDSTLMRLAK